MDDTPTDIARRSLVKGLGALPLASILASPALAAQAASTLEEVAITTGGGRRVTGALARPEALPAPAVLTIHEWWGLNDQIKAVTAEYARQGYLALAVDLFGGEVAETRERASALARGMDSAAGADIMASWSGWLRGHGQSSGKLGTVGWCFGGGWSLRTAVTVPVDACVIYYGRCDLPAEELARLQGPVMGHFGTKDGFIDEAMVARFAAAMNEAAKSYGVHWYEAEHGFANPTGARYDEADAQLAWARTLDFFGDQLR